MLNYLLKCKGMEKTTFDRIKQLVVYGICTASTVVQVRQTRAEIQRLFAGAGCPIETGNLYEVFLMVFSRVEYEFMLELRRTGKEVVLHFDNGNGYIGYKTAKRSGQVNGYRLEQYEGGQAQCIFFLKPETLPEALP